MDVNALVYEIEQAIMQSDNRLAALEGTRKALGELTGELSRLRTANDAGAAENGRLQLDNARLTAAIHAATALYRDSLAVRPETLAGRMYDALAAVDGDDER